VLARVRAEFDATAVQEPEVAAEIRETYARTGQVLDPHSAIGVRAARQLLATDPATPVVALATAHAAKFPDAVEAATGLRPRLPPHLAALMEGTERYTVLPAAEAAVERFIRERARILGAAA
jgi:threonine synthase